MTSNSAILMICLVAIAVSFATQKGSTRQSARINATTGIAPSVPVRERFLGTWELVSTEYRYADGTRRPYADVGPHGKGYLMYAGDGQFAVLCEEIEGEQDAISIAERLAAALAFPFDLEEAQVHLSASVGIALAGGRDADAEALIRGAAAAMRSAREHGGGRFEVFHPSGDGRPPEA